MNSKPEKPINEMDLAELKSQRSTRLRRKTKLEEEKKREEIQKRRLEEANKIHKQERIKNIFEKIADIFSNHKFKRISSILFFLAVIATLGAGFSYWYTHPNLNETKLKQALKPITVAVQKETGVKASKIIYTKHTATEWRVEYISPKGTERFDGRKLSRVCKAQAYIDAIQQIPIDKYRIAASNCR